MLGYTFLALTTLRALASEVIIPNNDPLIYYHGRWDEAPSTWWADSGFKINVDNLRNLSLTLGPNTTSPVAAIGVSIDHGEYFTVNVSQGANMIPLENIKEGNTTSVWINVEGWQRNRINLENIVLNEGAELQLYSPSNAVFQFIGDSLSAGQYLEKGINQAWPFLVGEYYNAEHRINAQPGAALSDIISYGNVHGISYQFFQTEDTGYFNTQDHNYTTPWSFDKDVPPPTHIVIHIGANDASHNITNDDFVSVYDEFLFNLRDLYPEQPIFILTPWGWPHEDGSIDYYYDGQYERIVEQRHTYGDVNVFLVNTTGWITYADVFPGNIHPSESGHAKVAGLLVEWLNDWRLEI